MYQLLAILFIAVTSFNIQAVTCTSSASCDDGLYCNGREVCAIPAGQTVGECRPARNGPCAAAAGLQCNERTDSCEKVMCKHDSECIDSDPCDGKRVCTRETGLDTFNNTTNVWGCKKMNNRSCPEDRICQPNRREPWGYQCTHPSCIEPDKDGDGHKSIACGGDDCNDEDHRVFAGNVEICDADDLDEDCNYESFGNRDQDRDGYIDIRCCNEDPNTGKKFCGNDCDDTNLSMFPGMQSCTRDPKQVYICGRGITNCGQNESCVHQPNGLGVCVPVLQSVAPAESESAL